MSAHRISLLIGHVDDHQWQYLPGAGGQKNGVRWKTLAGGHGSNTKHISFGICEVPPGERLFPHHHADPEVYYVYQGEAEVLLDHQIAAVRPGSVLFVPANLVHGIRNNGEEVLGLLWIFPTHKWSDVEYHADDWLF